MERHDEHDKGWRQGVEFPFEGGWLEHDKD